jgi:hypothetical protein
MSGGICDMSSNTDSDDTIKGGPRNGSPRKESGRGITLKVGLSTQELAMYKRIAEQFGKPDFKEGVPRREISEPGFA